MISLDYSPTDSGIEAQLQFDDSESILRFRAADMRKERTGLHGRCSILIDDYVLVWDQFNMDRDSDRNRLINRALKMPTTQAILDFRTGGVPFSAEALHHQFDQFCLHAFRRSLDYLLPEEVEGANIPLDFLAFPHVLNEGGTIMFAPPGRGKSYVALLLAVSVDQGIKEFWKVEDPRKTLFVNLERGASGVQRRLFGVNMALGCQPNRRLRILNARGRSLVDIKDILERAIEKDSIELIALDSLSRAGAGKLTSDDDANRTMDLLNNVCPSWFAIAHTPRADETHTFGSTMFEAAADIVINMLSSKRGDTSLGIGLKIVKGNDIPPQKLMVMELFFDPSGLNAVAMSSEKKFPELAKGREMSLTDQIAEYLLEAGKGTASDVGTALNKDRTVISRILANDPQFVNLGKNGRQTEYGVKA